jgi:hypothetical protein
VGAGWPEWQVDGLTELLKLFDAGLGVTNNPTGDVKAPSSGSHKLVLRLLN